ncbi:GNAT family N-acetyltransferase [Kribbella deserti]|uniref:GNAT family N-acetyltransferase n=1 Tax=Kribbella deserti TaxID=1926257 RepID=A0ABV6QWP5_9ACTN
MLEHVDEYLHAAPLSGSTEIEIGPFTLFRSTVSWPYYARPRAGQEVTPADVEALRAECTKYDVPLAIEWVVEVCPSLGPAARAAGLTVVEHPLLVLDKADFKPVDPPAGITVRTLAFEEAEFAQARAVAELAFANPSTAIGPEGAAERDAQVRDGNPEVAETLLSRAKAGVTVSMAAFGPDGVVASGAHQPVRRTSEIVGVATLPAMRRQGLAAAVTSGLVRDAYDNGVETVLLSAHNDAVAAVYERLGFHRIGHAGAAE